MPKVMNELTLITRSWFHPRAWMLLLLLLSVTWAKLLGLELISILMEIWLGNQGLIVLDAVHMLPQGKATWELLAVCEWAPLIGSQVWHHYQQVSSENVLAAENENDLHAEWILKRKLFMPKNYLSLTLIDFFTRFLGTESVTTKWKHRNGKLRTWKIHTLYLLTGTWLPAFNNILVT